MLTRPEALLWVPVLLGLFYVNRSHHGTHRERLRLIAPAVIVFVATAATIFRLAYFGFPPNTLYAKVSPSLAYRFTEGFRSNIIHHRPNRIRVCSGSAALHRPPG